MKELVLAEQQLGAMTVPAQTYSVADIKAMIAPNATDGELQMFCQLAQANNLDPFKREIYFIKYGGGKPSYVTGYQVYLQRAAMSGKLDGWEVSIAEKGGQPFSATITIHRNDMSKPVIWTVLASEFNSGQANWKKMPSFMLQKVAIGQGFRLAFPEYLSGMPYLAEEIAGEAEGLPLDPVAPTTPAATKGKKGKGGRKVSAKAPPKDVTAETEVEPVGGSEPPELDEYEGDDDTGEGDDEGNDEGDDEGEEQEEDNTPAGAPPVPEGITAPPPAFLDEEAVLLITKNFAAKGISEEVLTEVLGKPSNQWTASHRIYLQSAWHKLTNADPKKRISVEQFGALRYDVPEEPGF